MNACFVDIIIEFLAVAFHNILYYADVYPPSIFETRKKYSVVVYRSKHPQVNQYIDLCLKIVTECLKNDTLKRLEFAITDANYVPLLKFVFDFDKRSYYDEDADAYLIQAEQNLRSFCLNLASMCGKFKDQPEDKSFTVFLHTNESTAITTATNPELEDFPLIEVYDMQKEFNKVLPLRKFSLSGYTLQMYIELE